MNKLYHTKEITKKFFSRFHTQIVNKKVIDSCFRSFKMAALMF